MARGCSLADLNALLFEQIQNIMDPEDGADICLELQKSKAVKDLAHGIVENTRLMYDIVKAKAKADNYGDDFDDKLLLDAGDKYAK